jgi:hypothetical protein
MEGTVTVLLSVWMEPSAQAEGSALICLWQVKEQIIMRIMSVDRLFQAEYPEIVL